MTETNKPFFLAKDDPRVGELIRSESPFDTSAYRLVAPVQDAVADWNDLHDAVGSYADEHSPL
jgi:hypothetical protein